ncbi:hypothetical protein [Nocardioides hungaricus]
MTAASVGSCACSAVQRASELGVSSIAMPLICTGHGHLSPTTSLTAIRRGLDSVCLDQQLARGRPRRPRLHT